MNWKETYTKMFLTQLDKSTNDLTVKEYMSIWWQNTRTKDEGGLRLTDEGARVLEEIGLETYEILYPPEMVTNTQTVIFLDQFIDCPYYFTKKAIVVTSEKKAVELSLFSGDIRKYGMVKAVNRSKNLKNQE